MGEPTDSELDVIWRLAKQRDWDGAWTACSAIERKYPGSASGWRMRLYVLARTKRWKEAVDVSSAASERFPADLGFLWDRGRFRLNLDQFELAANDFTRVIEVGRQANRFEYDEAARFLRALARERLGDLDGACADLEGIPDHAALFAMARVQRVARVRARLERARQMRRSG